MENRIKLFEDFNKEENCEVSKDEEIQNLKSELLKLDLEVSELGETLSFVKDDIDYIVSYKCDVNKPEDVHFVLSFYDKEGEMEEKELKEISDILSHLKN